MDSGRDNPCGLGFPIRKSAGQRVLAPHSRLIAACYVLHRLCTPRHPPDALALTLDRSAFVPCPEKSPGHGTRSFGRDILINPDVRSVEWVRINRCATGQSRLHNVKRATDSGRSASRDPILIPSNSDSSANGCRSAARQAIASPVPRATSLLASKAGGADRDRTDDLKLAKLALSQLSYGPEGIRPQAWWARDELNVRPHAYQACALTT